MITTLVLLIALSATGLLTLAKHGKRRRRYRRYLRGPLDEELNLGTLASKALVAQAVTGVVNEQAWISSINASWALSDFSNNAGDGPIMVGIAHSDYSAAEIEAWIENANSWNQASLVDQEIAKRKIRMVGIFRAGELGTVGGSRLENGRQMRTKCNWLLSTGQTIDIWAYNMGGSPLDTTDPQVSVVGHANIWPK